MSGALFRLFVRRNLIWELLVVAVLARVLSVVCGVLGDLWLDEIGPGVPVYESPGVLRIHLALLVGVGVGIIANFTLQDLGYCRSSWTLPNLGRELRRELGWLAVGVALVTGLGFAVFDGDFSQGLGFVAATSLALFGFGLGTLVWDSHVGRGLGYLAQLVLLSLLGFFGPDLPVACEWIARSHAAGGHASWCRNLRLRHRTLHEQERQARARLAGDLRPRNFFSRTGQRDGLPEQQAR